MNLKLYLVENQRDIGECGDKGVTRFGPLDPSSEVPRLPKRTGDNKKNQTDAVR